ncbi:hypothetical protein Agub_g7821 [Astrephomene gubernaculifera]|uniref:NAD-dependent epimerase/dehydratase domain-containing protein n=1 Tax=Astrephomene gubernaculifera TaxID=47775 RepID=A0AAD3HMK1_9CHLO|nr:hypothetical protein Agub_g7821 [Astrephomene gubernaculifera]
MTRVVLFGGTGMVGQGCLREILLDSGITNVLAIGRRSIGKEDPKLRDVVIGNLSDLSAVATELKSVDACLYCLGTSAAGMKEAEYTAVTKTLTLNVLDALLAENPNMRFLYVSGAGSDAKSSTMWARVKGETENEILARAPNTAAIFRPGLIEPLHGIKGQQSLLYKLMYAATPLLRGLGAPVTSTETLGRAMVAVAKGASTPKKILENDDINNLVR